MAKESPSAGSLALPGLPTGDQAIVTAEADWGARKKLAQRRRSVEAVHSHTFP